MEGTQATGQAAQYDKLELSQDQSQVTLDVPDGISIEIPRAWTIMSETMESWDKHLQASLHEAESGLVGLPSDFTMKEYDSYVREPFSTLA